MHIRNPFRSGKTKSADSGSAWSIQDLVGGSPATVVHHHPRMRFVVTVIAVLLITAGVGLVMSDAGLLSTNILTGSGSTAKNACDYAGVQAGTVADPCDLVAGLSCMPGNQCRCKEGVWNGARCVVSAATPDVRVRVPDFAQCGPRCSTRYSAVSVSYLSQNADCVTPVEGSETYQRDCACADGSEAYADFTLRCEEDKLAASPTPSDGSTASCSAPMCASGSACVCCNGSTAADCSLSCPGSPEPVTDCSACGPSCGLSTDGKSCTCSDLSGCPNGATDAPTCLACPMGRIGSVCASAPNACGGRNTGEVLSSCECSAIAPDDADCPTTGSSILDGMASTIGASLVANDSGMVTPVRFALDMEKAGYADGHVQFDVSFVFTNVSTASVILSRVAVDLDRPFGGMTTAVSAIMGNGLVANTVFDGRKNDELLGPGNNTIAPGASARVALRISVETNARQLQWELPVSLAVEVPSTGEKMSYDPPPATLGLLKKPVTTKAVSTVAPSGISGGGPLEFGMLLGSIFHDADGNGVQNSEEQGIAYAKVVVTDGNGIQQVLTTDARGKYDTLVVAGQTSVAVSSDNPVLGPSPRFTTPSFSESFVAPGNVVSIGAVGVSFASDR